MDRCNMDQCNMDRCNMDRCNMDGVWGKSCTGGITLKIVLDLSVLHSYLNQINNKTLTPNLKSDCSNFPHNILI